MFGMKISHLINIFSYFVENMLMLEAIDLNDFSVNLNELDLVIANLIVEYLRIINFIK